MTTHLPYPLSRALHSLTALVWGWTLASLSLLFLDGSSPSLAGWILFLILTGPYCIGGWLFVFLPLTVFLDLPRERWSLLAWPALTVAATTSSYAMLDISQPHLAGRLGWAFVLVLGLLGGLAYAWLLLRQSTYRDLR